MKTTATSATELRRENTELRARLDEAEETLRAIRAGEVDAMVVGGQVYSLRGAETPYRIIIETMNEGAATLMADGTVLYANLRLAEMLQTSLESLLGYPLRQFVPTSDLPDFDALLARSQHGSTKANLSLRRRDARSVPVQLSCNTLDAQGAVCVVVIDLTERIEAQEALRDRAELLGQFNTAAVGRELRMIELKAEVNHLARQLNRPQPYDLDGLIVPSGKPS